jgi:tetratricopeptide (TPR) repeat protein
MSMSTLSPPAKKPGRAKTVAHALLLAALTVAVFAATVRNGFVSLDDKSYIYENPQVLRGLSWETALWALRSTENANWYPLRRLTNLLDASLFGMWAGGHHLMSVAWHAAAAVLLFLALRLMTGLAWRSFAVAALFAVHPVQVESVAWAAERSNVLAGFFFGLTLLLWARYARCPGPGSYAAAAVSLALGLMAKPTLTTVPFLLMLLDYWPLNRLGAPGAPPWLPEQGRLKRSFLEKVPLLAFAAGSGAVAVWAHWRAGSLLDLEVLPLWSRLGNALLSYWRYLGALLWPAGLAVYYPHPGLGLRVGLAVVAGLCLAAVTATFLAQARRRPWLGVGWLWYLGMSAPMIGIVQFAAHAMADRFVYLSAVGCFLGAVWLVASALRAPRAAGFVALAAVVVALGAATMAQTGRWRDSRTLFEHALASVQPSAFVLTNLGITLVEEGRVAEALPMLERAVRLGPRDQNAHNGLGYALSLSSRPVEALEQFRIAVELKPDFVEGRSNLGIALTQVGRHAEAREQLLEAVRIDPDYAPAYNNLGNVNGLLGRDTEAIASYRRALALRPTMLSARFNLGVALLKVHRAGEAAAAFEEVLRIAPDHARARSLLLLARKAEGSNARVSDSPPQPAPLTR